MTNLKIKKKQTGEKKRIWKVKEEEMQRQFEKSKNVLEVAKEVCGATMGHWRMQRETWW